MRAFFVIVIALAAMLPGVANASDYLYTFTGIEHEINDGEEGYSGPGGLTLRVRDSFHHVLYTYSPTGSSAIGGPDYAAAPYDAPGTLFPVDGRVFDAHGSYDFFTPLQDGYRTDENYSASIQKDLAAKGLSVGYNFERVIPETRPNCSEGDHCCPCLYGQFASALVFSDAFTSPDFREVGSFDLAPGSTARIGYHYTFYEGYSFVDEYDLSHLTVERLPDAVPEPDAWIMMISGLGFTGAAMRRRRNTTARFTSAY